MPGAHGCVTAVREFTFLCVCYESMICNTGDIEHCNNYESINQLSVHATRDMQVPLEIPTHSHIVIILSSMYILKTTFLEVPFIPNL